MNESLIQILGLCAAVVLPLWNIPLIVHIIKRRSSKDISLWWAIGVWTCLIIMAPSGMISKDIVWKVFCIINLINLILFSGVVVTTLIYRKDRQ